VAVRSVISTATPSLKIYSIPPGSAGFSIEIQIKSEFSTPGRTGSGHPPLAGENPVGYGE